MWNIADILMLVSKWSPILEDAQPEITRMLVWITIKNVPRSMFSWKGLGFLASKVGEPKRLHPETESCKKFDEAKVFVEVDLMKNLPTEFTFELERGKEAVVEFTYPWLPSAVILSRPAKPQHILLFLNEVNPYLNRLQRRKKCAGNSASEHHSHKNDCLGTKQSSNSKSYGERDGNIRETNHE